MNTHSHDFVTVDMRGLKTALVVRAQAERVSVPVLLRGAVARGLGLLVDGGPSQGDAPSGPASRAASVEPSICMFADEAWRLDAGAQKVGLSRGAYPAGLVAKVPELSASGSRAEHIASLLAFSAELSTLSRNIHRQTAFLRQANLEPARPYRDMLDTLAGDVRSHLRLAARCLAELQPRSRGAMVPGTRPTPAGDYGGPRCPKLQTSTAS